MTNWVTVAGTSIELVGVTLAGLEFWLFPPDEEKGARRGDELELRLRPLTERIAAVLARWGVRALVPGEDPDASAGFPNLPSWRRSETGTTVSLSD